MARILLSEGSSLSSRETVTALGLAGHEIEVLTNDSHCLGRFSRFVRAVHKAPSAGSDPSGYLAAALDTIAKRKIDVVIPVHEQGYLFAARRARMPADVGLALASFQSFEEVQSKERFARLLARVGIPQPKSQMCNLLDLSQLEYPYPFFVKTSFGTASEGVWRISNLAEKRALIKSLALRGVSQVLVQEESCGKLERAQSVFDRGRLVAFHAYRQLAGGLGGGDILKASVLRPDVASQVEKIGRVLDWHGALSFDYIRDDKKGEARFIDANPRLVEPMNALLSGVDLAGALVEVSLGRSPKRQPPGTDGVVMRLGMMGLMAAAARRGRRRDVLREAMLMAAGKNQYEGSVEELTPLKTDFMSLVPLAAVLLRLLRSPKSSSRMASDTVRNYCLTLEAIEEIQAWHAETTAAAVDTPA